MPRIKIELPKFFRFSTVIPVRITDINYGGHVGNDTVLSLIHEARVQFLQSYGYRELDMEGVGIIMSDVAIEFKAELFYGDLVSVSVHVAGFTRVSFDIYYKLDKEMEGKNTLLAVAKTGMVCYDYKNKKITGVPQRVKEKLK